MGDFETAARLGAESLQRATSHRDLTTVVRASVMLRMLPHGTPGLPDAVPTREALLVICREVGDVVAEGWMLGSLAWVALAADDMVRVAGWSVEGLRLGQRTAALSAGGFAVASLVIAAATRGDDVAAARLHGSIASALPMLQVGLTAAPTAVYFAAVDAVRGRLGPEAFAAAAAEGALLTWDAALAAALEYAASFASPAASRSPVRVDVRRDDRSVGRAERLTPREVDVLRLLARRDSNKDIALALGLRPKTVMHHSVSIYAKIGARGRAEATAWAFRHGLILDLDGA